VKPQQTRCMRERPVVCSDHRNEEDHQPGLAADRGKSFVVDETGSRSRPRSFVSRGIVVVVVVLIALCAPPLEVAGWTDFPASSWNDRTVVLSLP
jgi:hypothetical protein